MKSSIRVKFFLIVLLMNLMFLSISIGSNVFFLQKYYNKKNKEMFLKMYKQYEIMVRENVMEKNSEAEKLERLSGAKVFVANLDYNVIHANIRPKRDEALPRPPEPPLYSEVIKMIENAKKNGKGNSKIVVEGEYEDERIGLKMFLMVFLTNENEYFVIDRPSDSIREGAEIANNFSLITSAIILLFGLVSAIIISKKITAPIVIIDDILMRIAKFDFSRRYNGKAEDEIGNLGKNLNLISDELKSNIENLEKVNEQLSIEIERKDKIDAMRKEFISDASHELKTPISLIRSYSEGLKFGIVSSEEEQMDYYDIIIDEADKMGKLVSTLLEISELDSGEYKIELKEADLHKLITSIVAKYGPVFVEKDIEINIDVSKNTIIFCDLFKIGQVIENYLCNAIDHVSGDIKTIRIYAEEKSEVVRVSVYNSGKNIPEESCNLIWNDFYKEDKARTRTYGGAGLGLAIVRRIIELHNGRYGVVNKNYGVEFWFELKRDK